MKKRLDHILSFCSRFIPYTPLGSGAGIDYLRGKLLYAIVVSTVLLGFVAYVPSIYLSVKEKLWSIAIVDTAVYVLLIASGFSRKLSARFKIMIILGVFYVLGIVLLLITGPLGAGFIWLFLFGIMAGVFLGTKAVVATTIINAVSLGILSVPIILRKPEMLGILQYTPMLWLVNCVNFLLINFLLSVTLAIVISRLNKSLVQEMKYTDLLEEEKGKLEIEKEKALKADRLKTAFLANMSHEIRTPMNGILGFTELLRGVNGSKDKNEKYLNIIHDSGKRMLRIIDDIINISKIESGHVELHCEEINVNEVLDDLYNFFMPQMEKKGLEFHMFYGLANENCIVNTDKTKFVQVLVNLINNAVKFTPEGRVDVGYSQKDKYLEFYVKDTGYGIETSSMQKVFERFHRVEHTKNKIQEGTGLGLAISKAYVEMLGGQIWVRSKVGEGTGVYFTVPMSLSDML